MPVGRLADARGGANVMASLVGGASVSGVKLIFGAGARSVEVVGSCLHRPGEHLPVHAWFTPIYSADRELPAAGIADMRISRNRTVRRTSSRGRCAADTLPYPILHPCPLEICPVKVCGGADRPGPTDRAHGEHGGTVFSPSRLANYLAGLGGRPRVPRH